MSFPHTHSPSLTHSYMHMYSPPCSRIHILSLYYTYSLTLSHIHPHSLFLTHARTHTEQTLDQTSLRSFSALHPENVLFTSPQTVPLCGGGCRSRQARQLHVTCGCQGDQTPLVPLPVSLPWPGQSGGECWEEGPPWPTSAGSPGTEGHIGALPP